MPRVEPFPLAPVLVEKPWGGRRLSELGKHPGVAYFGESWEVADLPSSVAPHLEDPCSRVAAGPWQGWALGALGARLGDDLMGPVPLGPDGRFPLLVKLLDAREHLSIQVHPDDDYVSTHPSARHKTESWYVVDADPGAVLFLDVDEDVTAEQVGKATGSSMIVPMLRRVPASPGSFHHLPAGMVHALGAGVLIAEVQTPSDTTFRLYDWVDEYERDPRPLHPAETREAIRLHPDDAVDIDPITDEDQRRELIATPHYRIAEHRRGPVSIADAPGPRIVMAVSGTTTVGGLVLETATTAIVPHSALDTEITTDGTCLEISM